MTNLDWLKKFILTWYGLEIRNAQKVRAAWMVETPSGPKCFKQVHSLRGKAEFAAYAVQHLLNKGFTETVPFLKTLDGAYVVEAPEGVFYLTDWIRGREGNMTNLQDVLDAARVLARMHRMARGFTPPVYCKSRESFGQLPEEWEERRQELETYQTFAQHDPDDPFNRLYLVGIERYLERCRLAQNILNSCNYQRLVEQERRWKGFCHKDFTYHNFIIDEHNKLYVIDFDYCSREIRTYDLGRYLRRVAKHFNWDITAVRLVLAAYHQEEPLSADELIFILAFLYFPQRFWRIANRNFKRETQSTEQYLYKQLEQELRFLPQEEEFLNALGLEISRSLRLRW